MLLSEADRAERYLIPNQPGRVPLSKIGCHEENRGGQGIMQFHAHDIAYDISTKGTSKRRYGRVRLVEVPEKDRRSGHPGYPLTRGRPK